MRCECQKHGAIHSGVTGVLAGPPDEMGSRYVERCDTCERFDSDEAAGLEYARIRGGGSRYDRLRRVRWNPQ